MGAAGDMLTAALLELLPDPEGIMEELNALGIPGVTIEKERVSKCGIGGTHITVKINGAEEGEIMQGHSHGHHDSHGEHAHHEDGHYDSCGEHAHHHDSHAGHVHAHEPHHHHHSGMHDIEHIVRRLSVSDKVRNDILAVYTLIAEAESHAHGVPVTEIHFHEVGAMDAVADVAAVCLLMERIAPDRVIASPVHVGSGQVKCAHGILPVPAPATAYILRDIPIYGGQIRGELCTPTGAALLKYFVAQFGDMPVMKTTVIGYGMGRKDFPAANCVRALLGETEDRGDMIVELNCNVDDMTGEAIGFAMEALFAAGALEVYTVPIGMKKSRPGTLFSVMCREEDKDKMVRLLFRHTTTIGIREKRYNRYTLDRSVETIRTPYGDIRQKISTGYGVTRQKYEYEDLAKAARENDLSVSQILGRL